MNGLYILRRTRIILLFLLASICFIFAVLFAILLHNEWSYSYKYQKILIAGLLLLHVLTAILLCLMAFAHYYPWEDVVPMFILLAFHIVCSLVFTYDRPSLLCRGFGTETACKEFIFAIFVGCWVVSGIILWFATILVVMAFIPQLPVTEVHILSPIPHPIVRVSQPVKSLLPVTDVRRLSPTPHPIVPRPVEHLDSSRGTEDDPLLSDDDSHKADSPKADERPGPAAHDDGLEEEPLSPYHGPYPADSIHKVGSPTEDERRTFLPSTSTALVTHNDELRGNSLSRDHDTSLGNSIHRIPEPPRFSRWQNFYHRNSKFTNGSTSYGGTISPKNSPGGGTSTDSGSRALSPFSFRDSSTGNHPIVRKIGRSKESLSLKTARSFASIANPPP